MDVKEEPVVNDEDAMAVDDHPPAPEPSRRVSTRRSGANTQQVITQEVQHIQTARRTSSDAPETDIDEQAQHEAEVAAVLDVDVAPEAAPDGDEWDNFDTEDSDDPLMASEYVVEIFKHTKLTEVRVPKSFYRPVAINKPPSACDASQSGIYGIAKRVGLADAWNPSRLTGASTCTVPIAS
jgi:hypothetical protein